MGHTLLPGDLLGCVFQQKISPRQNFLKVEKPTEIKMRKYKVFTGQQQFPVLLWSSKLHRMVYINM